MKLWSGRLNADIDALAEDFNSSIASDSRMAAEDMLGSIAHAEMLGSCGIISGGDAEQIICALKEMLDELESGSLHIDMAAEDIHTFVEAELTRRIGSPGKRLHTARSRNDQVATDIRLSLRKEAGGLIGQLRKVIEVLCAQAAKYANMVMPGYTHMQRAQPVTFGHHLLAYAEMLSRDMGRFQDAVRRMNFCPLGSGAIAGTTYPIDREMTARALGFDGICHNSIDAVSDRDFCAELAFAAALSMVHLSRLCEELILWCSWEFRFIELDDAYSTGSSMMPQKKNPDIAELIRGKSGRAIGDLTALLVMLKGLPLAYDKDMQEDKDAIFDSLDTLSACLLPLGPMLSTMRANGEHMREAAGKGFINATDCADYLVSEKGLPFREAYSITGALVAKCVELGQTLETLPLEAYREQCPAFDEGVYKAVDLGACLARRRTPGGPAPENVLREAAALMERIK